VATRDKRKKKEKERKKKKREILGRRRKSKKGRKHISFCHSNRARPSIPLRINRPSPLCINIARSARD
jgi:hypothetical protein